MFLYNLKHFLLFFQKKKIIHFFILYNYLKQTIINHVNLFLFFFKKHIRLNELIFLEQSAYRIWSPRGLA